MLFKPPRLWKPELTETEVLPTECGRAITSYKFKSLSLKEALQLLPSPFQKAALRMPCKDATLVYERTRSHTENTANISLIMDSQHQMHTCT